MRSIDVEVRNPSGLHARPAAVFVKAAAAYRSTITVENLDRGTPPVNAKSIISFLGGGIAKGHTVRIVVDGEDEEAAVVALHDLVASGLGEEFET
jgi:phosphotransferase system HPr (HPr) family protein